MPLELYLAYLAAAAVVLVIPGPTITLVVGYALAEGRRAAWATVAGVALGDLTAVTLSLAGLGALLAASATLFTAVKWAGAAYLVYLGIRLWRTEPTPEAVEGPAGRSPRKMLVHAWAVTSLNPKSIVFFVAFLPQFVASGHPVLPQLVILGASFVAMAALNAAGYAWLAGRARRAIARPAVLKLVNRVGGGILVGAGLATVAMRRA
jgi:threonine/homoserine/homoserine lactone efflux protein